MVILRAEFALEALLWSYSRQPQKPTLQDLLDATCRELFNKYLLLIIVMEFYGCSQPTRCIEVVQSVTEQEFLCIAY